MAFPGWAFSGGRLTPFVAGAASTPHERPAPARMDSEPGVAPLAPAARERLERWARSRTAPGRVVIRARIVLLAASGRGSRSIATELGVSAQTARLWWKRFLAGGVEAIARDLPGRGRKPRPNAELAEKLRALRASSPPGGGAWSTRRLAVALGVSHSTVHRVRRLVEHAAVDTGATPAGC